MAGRTCRNVYVIDASIIFEFYKVNALPDLFSLPGIFLVPDIAAEAELQEARQTLLTFSGYCEKTFDSSQIAQLRQYLQRFPNLGLMDCSYLLLAKRDDAILLTGDRALRRTAQTEFRLKVHGTLWILDQLVRLKLRSPNSVAELLKKMMSRPQCRLPRDECEKRLRRWRR